MRNGKVKPKMTKVIPPIRVDDEEYFHCDQQGNVSEYVRNLIRAAMGKDTLHPEVRQIITELRQIIRLVSVPDAIIQMNPELQNEAISLIDNFISGGEL